MQWLRPRRQGLHLWVLVPNTSIKLFVISRTAGEGFFCAKKLCPALRMLPRVAELPGLSGRSARVLGSKWAGWGGRGPLSCLLPWRVQRGTPQTKAPHVSRPTELGSGRHFPKDRRLWQHQVWLLPGQARQWSVMSVAETPGQPAGAAAQRGGPGEKWPFPQSCTSGVLIWGGVGGVSTGPLSLSRDHGSR